MSASVLDRLANGGTQPVKKNESGVSVIPYNASLDPNADKFLPWFWNRLKDDGLIALYFPGGEKTGFASFVQMMSSNVRILLVVKHDESGEPLALNTVGFATLGPVQIGGTMAAHAGFIFLKEYWDRTTTYAAAKEIMDTWFGSPEVKLDVILGVVASDNTLAKRFLEKVGWTHSGDIPYLSEYHGKRCDATFWYITREMWEQSK